MLHKTWTANHHFEAANDIYNYGNILSIYIELLEFTPHYLPIFTFSIFNI